MRRVLRVPAIVVALAAGAIAVGIPSGRVIATEAASGGCERSVGEEEHAQRLREAVGLPNSADLVAASFSLPGYSCVLAGIPLSADEEAAFLDVLDAQAELSDLHETVAGDPAFAGAWLDAGTLTIASTDGKLGGDLQPEKGSIELRAAQFTQAELDAVGAEVGQLTEDSAIGPLAAEITYVAVDVRANQVAVGVAVDVQTAAPAFAKAYGNLVSVYFAEPAEGGLLACTVDDCGTKGGLAIDHPAMGCTSGFLAKSKLYGGTTYSRRILTAGHCISGTGGVSNTQNWHNPAGTQTWGDNFAMDFYTYEIVDGTQFCPVPNVKCLHNDLGLISVGSNPPADWNQYFTGGSPGYIEIDGSKTKSNQLVGQVVYRNGRTSGLDAGAITAKPIFKLFTGANCGYTGYSCRNYNVIEVGVGSANGDSGSGFYRVQQDAYGGFTRNAYGILSKGIPGYTYYYSWDQPLYADWFFTDRRSVYPCISTSCPL